MYNASTNYGLKFYDELGINIISPATIAGANLSGSVSLGYISAQFSDLWLAGTGYTGALQVRGGDATFQDSSNVDKMRWDASAGSLGIGTVTPVTLLDVAGENPVLTLRDSRTGGTWSAETALGKIDFRTSDATGIGAHSIASIGVVAGGSNTASPDGELVFATGSYNAVSTERMRIDSSGKVGIGESAPTSFYRLAVTLLQPKSLAFRLLI